MLYKTFQLTADVSISYIGPELEFGPLPAVFYFALSAEETLTVDPFNQFVVFLSEYPLRIFSMTLPHHSPGLGGQAIRFWSHSIAANEDIIGAFTDKVTEVVAELLRKDVLIPGKIGVAGLSRGAFIATHVAAKNPQICSLLGFAPLVDLAYSKEFLELQDHPLTQALHLRLLINDLIGRHVRFYIGNVDTWVGTANAFNFIQELSLASFHQKIRSPQTELMISPSIGHKGHGTPKEVFHQGALWMANQLRVKNETF